MIIDKLKVKNFVRLPFFISLGELRGEHFSEAVRGHCLIENRLHRVLDITMNGDVYQIYHDNSAENLACMHMLRAESSTKLTTLTHSPLNIWQYTLPTPWLVSSPHNIKRR
ncbi:hypothetical protein TUM17377_09510 [Shewanella chilikensis]|nr:hypothetical protein TUM17377_09510 [Shewanella chilikensis]